MDIDGRFRLAVSLNSCLPACTVAGVEKPVLADYGGISFFFSVERFTGKNQCRGDASAALPPQLLARLVLSV